MSASIREREPEDTESERSVKRVKVDDRNMMEVDNTATLVEDSSFNETVVKEKNNNPLPSSHSLLGIPQPSGDGFVLRILERDVGISEYVGRDAPSINGIIKQRYEYKLFSKPSSSFIPTQVYRLPRTRSRFGWRRRTPQVIGYANVREITLYV
jgi:hypothetical protein